MNQNQTTKKIFSFKMFKDRMHNPSKRCIPPDGPYLWKEHLVTFGNILSIGSANLFSGDDFKYCNTSWPYVKKPPPMKVFRKNIWLTTLTKFINSHMKYIKK